MKIDFFSAKPYDKLFFDRFNLTYGFDLEYHDTHLAPDTVDIIKDATAICVFVNDKLTADVIEAVVQK